MSDKAYIGRAVAGLERYQRFDPITRVTLLIDDETYVTAGDDTGRTLEASLPWGTSQIASKILARVNGFSYQPFAATDAIFDPATETGDGVTVGGMYGQLASTDITFDHLFTADISAPHEGEIDHEYPFVSSATRTVNRKIAQTRSLITKTAEEISLEVSDLADQYTKVSVTLDGLTVTDPSGTTVIRGDMIQTDTLYVNAANITGTLTASQINLTGAITFDDLNDDVSGSITNAQSTANGAASTASSAWSIARQIANGTFSGGTFIDGKKIYSPTIYAENFSVVPTSVTAFGQTGGSFNLYGYYSNTLYHFLSIEYYAGDSPAVWFKSPDDAACYMQFDGLNFYGSNVDFTGATVTGLTATFG